MRFSPDSDVVGDFGALLDPGDFESSIPARSTFESAYADPRAQLWTSEGELAKDLASTSVRGWRHLTAAVGVDVGVPSEFVNDFATAISLTASDQVTTRWVEFIAGAQDAIIDIAVEAMGAVPIVGWVVRAGKALIDGIIAASASDKPRPALVEYDDRNDVDIARKLLGKLRGTDWTWMFRPAWDVPDDKNWRRPIEQDRGYLWKPRPEFASGGYGCVPGGAFGSAGVQSRNCYTPSPGGAVDVASRRDCILDIYDVHPAANRVALSAWQSMTASATATCFNVDTRGIADEWERYCLSGIRTGRTYSAGGQAMPNWFFRMAALNLEDAMYVRHWSAVGRDGRPIPMRSAMLSDVARAQLENLRERQESQANTYRAAYCSRQQAAFRDPKLLSILEDRRRALLQGERKWSIRSDDVIDDDFREALVAATPESQRPPPQRVPGAPQRVPPPLPMPEPDLESGGGGGGGIVVLAALLGVGYATRRWWMPRSR